MKKYLFLPLLLASPLFGVEAPKDYNYLYALEPKNEEEECADDESDDESDEDYDEEAERDQQLKYKICLPPLRDHDAAEIREEQFHEATSWPGQMTDQFYDEFLH